MEDQTPRPSSTAVHTDGKTTSSFILRLIYGFAYTQMLYVAVKLGVLDNLADRPSTVSRLAAELSVDADALSRVLRGLSNVGLLSFDEDLVSLSSRAHALLSSTPGSLAPIVRYYGSPYIWSAWGHLEDAVVEGRTAFELTHGMAIFDYLETHPDDAAAFDTFMNSLGTAHDIAAKYDFSGVASLVDVGGGHGASTRAVLEANPMLRATLFDLPEVIAGAQHQLTLNPSVRDRVELVPGDFFREVPAGAEVYLLSNVLHDWDDDKAVTILRTCRDAMDVKSRLLVVEALREEDDARSTAWLLDVQMLVVGGRQRSVHDFEALLHQANLKLNRVIHGGRDAHIVEAICA